jgi:hypothetical protein
VVMHDMSRCGMPPPMRRSINDPHGAFASQVLSEQCLHEPARRLGMQKRGLAGLADCPHRRPVLFTDPHDPARSHRSDEMAPERGYVERGQNVGAQGECGGPGSRGCLSDAPTRSPEIRHLYVYRSDRRGKCCGMFLAACASLSIAAACSGSRSGTAVLC